jgi:tetratricopeptide (TPR) repeat protein
VLHNNYGWTLHDAGDYPAALTQFREALAVYKVAESAGSPMDIHIAHWAIARCLRSLGRYNEALAIQLRLAANEDRDRYVDEEIAELQKALAES